MVKYHLLQLCWGELGQSPGGLLMVCVWEGDDVREREGERKRET